MAPKRLPASRIAGIIAWTAASVTWGTAVVAIANVAPEPPQPEASADPEPVVLIEPQAAEVLAPVPTMPESGLVVLRYTPSEKPEAQVVVRRVVVSSPSGGGSTAAATPAPAPTKVKSSSS
jgi:hypothetical protein